MAQVRFTLRALSIRQPWADAIVRGDKDIENRTWNTTVRGPILIHAAWNVATDVSRAPLCDWTSVADRTRLPRGGVVGVAMLEDVVTEHASKWFVGPIGFVLAEPMRVPFSPCLGSPRLFWVRVDDLCPQTAQAIRRFVAERRSTH